MVIHRVVLGSVCLSAAAVLSVAAVDVSRAYSPLTWSSVVHVLVVILALGSGAAVVVWLLARVVRRVDPAGVAGGYLELGDDGTLTVIRKRLFLPRRVVDRVSMDRVGAVTWDSCPILINDVMMIEFWDRDPQLDFVGFGFRPAVRGHLPLMVAPLRYLRGSPEDTHRLRLLLQARGISCNVDLDTLEPIPELLPPLGPGVEVQGRTIVRRPQSPVGDQ